MIGDILQPSHLLFILVIALLVLGPKKLPEVGRALGRGMRDFRNALSGADPREEIADLHQSAAAVGHQAMQPDLAPAIEPKPEPEPAAVPAAAPAQKSVDQAD